MRAINHSSEWMCLYLEGGTEIAPARFDSRQTSRMLAHIRLLSVISWNIQAVVHEHFLSAKTNVACKNEIFSLCSSQLELLN